MYVVVTLFALTTSHMNPFFYFHNWGLVLSITCSTKQPRGVYNPRKESCIATSFWWLLLSCTLNRPVYFMFLHATHAFGSIASVSPHQSILQKEGPPSSHFMCFGTNTCEIITVGLRVALKTHPQAWRDASECLIVNGSSACVDRTHWIHITGICLSFYRSRTTH